jgi:hypothetical protein
MLEKNINLVVDNQDLKGKILSLEKVVREKNSEIVSVYRFKSFFNIRPTDGSRKS